MNSEIELLRREIDRINQDIIKLIKRRFKITDRITDIKKRNNLKFRDPFREKSQIIFLRNLAKKHGMDEDVVANIFQIIFTQVVKKAGK